MTLLSEVKYETSIKAKDMSSESVLSMLQDVRVDIGKLEGSFADVDLIRVLAVVEAGKYEVNGNVSIRIDLSSANEVIDTYRRYSEEGCLSCVSLGIETISAQDTITAWYCQVSDPGYDDSVSGDIPRVRYKGFSSKIRKHHSVPCDSWEPRCSPKLEELIGAK